MGNPHAVIFVDDIKTAPLIAIGPRIERHEAFPDGVNVEFVEIISENKLCMRVWEPSFSEDAVLPPQVRDPACAWKCIFV